MTAAPYSPLVERAAKLGAETDALYRDLDTYFKGKSVRILCPRYNGQPCGTSKPKLQGRVLVVSSAAEHRGKVFLGFSDYQDSIELGKVEVLP
jgi:hypothetical protein